MRAAEVEGPSSGAATLAESLLLGALAVWRQLRAEQERLAAEEAQLFKTKTRGNSIMSETVRRRMWTFHHGGASCDACLQTRGCSRLTAHS